MMIIYNSLEMGGVETFILRLAKERFRKGKKTKILLTATFDDGNKDLVKEISQYAEIYRLKDFLSFPKIFHKIVTRHFYLLFPMSWKKLASIFEGVNHIHVANSYDALIGLRLMRSMGREIPITTGIYHSKEFTWRVKGELPFFEKINRQFFLNVLPKENVIFFNDRLVSQYEKVHSVSFAQANCFPLGVIESFVSEQEKKINEVESEKRRSLSIVSVGRLVEFKSYNIWMLDVVKELKENGIGVVYEVYGNGPMEDALRVKAKELQIENCYRLNGVLEYSDFNTVVSKFDIFVGSGTAIVQAAGLGVASIIGIENIETSNTYGFFSDINGFSYNEPNLYETTPVVDSISRFLSMDETSRSEFSNKHIQKAAQFSIERCEENFHMAFSKSKKIDQLFFFDSLIGRLCYSVSLFFFCLLPRLKKKSAYDISRSD